MKELLEQISRKAIQLGDFEFSAEIQSSKWLGEDPALLSDIETVEQRLGLKLPEDYCQFLLLCNGFLAPIGTEPEFEPIENIDFLVNVDNQDIISSYSLEGLEDVSAQLKRAIIISSLEEEQYFLLIPPTDTSQKWKYWKFAHWIPGEEVYDSLQHYFKEVDFFLEEEILNK